MNEITPDVISVGELNRLARFAVERALPIRWVVGEISNLTRAPSGHWYFTLKDSDASVRCAMFRNRNQFLDWRPENGMRVEVKAQATVYEARGEFQLGVEAMRRAGLGALFEAYARLKEKLEREGLFDPARKRPLPAYPARIGIVTSAKAAALRDVLTTLRRRWPSADLVVYPTLVQGRDAPEGIVSALRAANLRAACDVLLLVRGGGSIEDLWAFNEEGVARAIAASTIPVVSGVGHETDFTIADFVSDLRAPTPTAAAQLATPDRLELEASLRHLLTRARHAQQRKLDSLAQRLDGAMRTLSHPAKRLADRSLHLIHLTHRLTAALSGRLAARAIGVHRLAERLGRRRPETRDRAIVAARLVERMARATHAAHSGLAARLATAQASLLHLNPERVLARGYSLVRDAEGRVVRDGARLVRGDKLDIVFARGGAKARVEESRED